MIQSLLKSRKAWVLFVMAILLGCLAITGKISAQEAIDSMKWLVSTWFAAVAVEDAATKLQNKPPEA